MLNISGISVSFNNLTTINVKKVNSLYTTILPYSKKILSNFNDVIFIGLNFYTVLIIPY
jgi:hypothetical protein